MDGTVWSKAALKVLNRVFAAFPHFSSPLESKISVIDGRATALLIFEHSPPLAWKVKFVPAIYRRILCESLYAYSIC